METEYRTMSDLFGGALYQRFVFFLHHIRSVPDGKSAFLHPSALLNAVYRNPCTIL